MQYIIIYHVCTECLPNRNADVNTPINRLVSDQLIGFSVDSLWLHSHIFYLALTKVYFLYKSMTIVSVNTHKYAVGYIYHVGTNVC